MCTVHTLHKYTEIALRVLQINAGKIKHNHTHTHTHSSGSEIRVKDTLTGGPLKNKKIIKNNP